MQPDPKASDQTINELLHNLRANLKRAETFAKALEAFGYRKLKEEMSILRKWR